MIVLVGTLILIILIMVFILAKYRRQIKDICRQMSFLMRHDSNMLISRDIDFGGIGELADRLNEFISLRQEEKREFQRKEKIISDTYTNLSHDIRTPLTSLDGYFQLLENSSDYDEQKKYIGIIQERISSLKDMLEELFMFTKLKSDEYKLELSRCCLNKTVKNTVFSYYDEWTKRGIIPLISIPDSLIFIDGNEQALRRILQNVIKNGLDHGKNNIGIYLSEEKGSARLCIINEVENPDEIDVSQVFDRFYKADSARSKTSSGLGLSIAEELAERMNGSLEAHLDGDKFCIEAVFKAVE